MDAHEAAQAVFPALARSLQKYLRVTRQQPRHTAEQVVRHLAHCLSFDMSPKAFLERFFANYPTMDVRMDI
jgi:vang-like